MRSPRILLALLAASSVAQSSFGQEPAAPATAPSIAGDETGGAGVLAVEVEQGAGGLDAGELRASIAREAGVRVTDAATPNGPRLVITGTGPSSLSFELVEGGRTVARTIELPSGSEPRRLSTAALVAASMLEDDAAELLARLRAEAKKAAPPEPQKPSPAALKRERAPLPPCTAKKPELVRWFGADVAPYAGTSSFEPPGTVRHISLELFGSGVAGVAGVEFSPFVTLSGGFVCGAQLSGLGSWTSGHVRGVEISGLVGWADRVTGAQVNGLLSVTTHRVTGAQIAMLSMADEIKGAQLGIFNIAGDVSGAQIGIVNVARKSDATVGVLSLVTEGRTTLHGFAGSDGVIAFAVQHGSRLVHNYYGGSISVAGKEGLGFGPSIGIGFHAYEGPRAFVDVDAIAHLLFSSAVRGDMQTLWQGRAVVGLRLAPAFAVYAGPFYDVLMVPKGHAPRAYDGTVLGRTVATGGGTLHLSPGLTVGVRGL
jgi:hypothetical protein